MAKKDNNEDEYQDENIDNSSIQDDEDFGLPDLDEDFDSDDDKEDIVVEETVKEEIITLEEEPVEESTFDTGETSDPIVFESAETTEASEESSEYEEEEEEDKPPVAYVPPKQSSAPVIAIIIILIIAAAALVWFFFIKDTKKEEKAEATPVKDTTTYVVEKPVQVEEPVIEEPEEEPEPEVGSINTLSSRTGRSYVVVGSFFDDDLAMDYAKKLKEQGTSSYIIPPFGKSKFTRVAVEEAGTFAEASTNASALAGQYQEQPWPLKY